jgi:hypothetical protein
VDLPQLMKNKILVFLPNLPEYQYQVLDRDTIAFDLPQAIQLNIHRDEKLYSW